MGKKISIYISQDNSMSIENKFNKPFSMNICYINYLFIFINGRKYDGPYECDTSKIRSYFASKVLDDISEVSQKNKSQQI